MKNYEMDIPQRILKKLLKLTTNPIRHFDIKNKLEILAVKAGIKPAFLGITEAGSPDVSDNILRLKQAAILLDLSCRVTNRPPPYFSSRPNVKSSFLNVWSRHILAGGKAIWIYRDIQVEPMISASIAGGLNEGYVLSYPQCCIKCHETNRVLEVESCFRDIEQYIARNPLALADLQGETEEEMYDALLTASFPHEYEDELFKSIDRHILESWRRYPFVPHWACQSCLSGESKETQRLNNKYKELAMKISPSLAHKIAHYISEYLEQHISNM